MDLAKASAVAVGLAVGIGLWLALPEPPPAPPAIQGQAARTGAVGGVPADRSARRAMLLYYHLPGCPGCEAVRELLGEMEPENPGIRFECRDALEETNEAAVEREFASEGDDHGALLLDGTGRVVWKAGGHALTRERVGEGISALTR